MLDVMMLLTGCLLIATIAVAIEYYRILLRAHKEYGRAKTAVEDIVLSFNRQLHRQDERLELTAYKLQGTMAKCDTAISKYEAIGKQLAEYETNLTTISEGTKEACARALETENRTRDIVKSQETIDSKIASMEEQAKKLPPVPEMSIEAVIPIKRDRALAALTGTEVAALELLSSEGPRTAPEMKSKIELSREHTARLMKKLYESGYLERDTSKIPFRYTIKKEMEKLLRRAETT